MVRYVKSKAKERFFWKMTAFSRFMLLVALVFSPWCYGSTRPDSMQFIITFILPTFGLWLISLPLAREKCGLPLVPLGCCIVIFLLGWFMALNAHYMFDVEYAKFAPINPILPFLPGSYDKSASLDQMLRVTALLATFIMAADMMQHRLWRLRLWWTVALTGVSICLLGLVQKLAGAPMIFWEQGRNGYYFFATYLYHGNAGAYINLILPWVMLLTFRAFQRGGGMEKALLVPGMMICLAAAFSHASKAAMAITMFLIIAVLATHVSALRALFRNANDITRLAAFVLIPLGVVALAASVGWRMATHRWEFWEVSKSIRMFAYDICLKASGDAGWFGFGPGSFSSVFDVYALRVDPDLDKVWRYAHQDYLQAVIEWGWMGASVIAILFGGAMVCLWMTARRFSRKGDKGKASFLLGTMIALFGVALHALVDFPLQILSLQLLAATFAGVGWGSLTWHRHEVRGRRRRVHAEDATLEPELRAEELEEPAITPH